MQESQLVAYTGWKSGRVAAKAALQDVVHNESLPTVTPKRMIQSSLFNNGAKRSMLNQKAARMVFMSPGCSARFMEHPETLDFLSSGIPQGYKPPCPTSLYGNMLDDEMILVECKTWQAINLQDPYTKVWVTCDVWESATGEYVFSMCISTPNAGVFHLHRVECRELPVLLVMLPFKLNTSRPTPQHTHAHTHSHTPLPPSSSW